MTESKPLILTLVGMPGAGKSSIVDHLKEKGYPAVYFGGINLKEIKRRGLDVNEESEKIVRRELREQYGKDSHAKLISEEINQLHKAGQHYIVADGLYSWSEYKYFKHLYGPNAVVVAIAASRKTRHKRLAKRPVRPLTETEASARDYNEIETIEKGGPIANADHTVTNDHDVQMLIAQIEKILRDIKFGPKYQ